MALLPPVYWIALSSRRWSRADPQLHSNWLFLRANQLKKIQNGLSGNK